MDLVLLAAGMGFLFLSWAATFMLVLTRDPKWDRRQYALGVTTFLLWGIYNIMSHNYSWAALDALLVLWAAYNWYRRGGGKGLKRKLKTLSEEGKAKLAKLAETVKSGVTSRPLAPAAG
jgi:hypothetical protein